MVTHMPYRKFNLVQPNGLGEGYVDIDDNCDGLCKDASSGRPLVIYGIWALNMKNISPSNNDAAVLSSAQMYVTADTKGPDGLSGFFWQFLPSWPRSFYRPGQRKRSIGAGTVPHRATTNGSVLASSLDVLMSRLA